ncbi:MAG TPA: hypothetical protein DCQ12_01290 [Candidatus Cloacimonas sp.]|jgi:hypothetical protein|nr:hypothetical protein [Candidatus Cloacimonas sp.]
MKYELMRFDSGSEVVGEKMKHYTETGFIVISTFKGGDPNPRRRRNYQVNSRSLKEYIRKSEYSFIPVWAGFEDWDEVGYLDTITEQAFVVFNSKNHEDQEDAIELKSLGLGWCKKYDLEGYFYREMGVDGKGHYIKASGEVELSFGSVSPTVATDIYFQALHRSASQKYPRALKYEERRIYLARAPGTVFEAYMRHGEVFFRIR